MSAVEFPVDFALDAVHLGDCIELLRKLPDGCDGDRLLAYWWWGWSICGCGGLGRPGSSL